MRMRKGPEPDRSIFSVRNRTDRKEQDMTVQRSGAMEGYEKVLQDELSRALETATRARAVGIDPRTSVEIPVASDLADRVEALLGIRGIAVRIRELEAG